MSYIIRNTIVLGVVLLVIALFGGFFTMISIPKKLHKVEADIKKIEVDLQNTPDLANQYNTLSAKFEEMKKRWELRNKDIPAKDIPSETYDYLNRMLQTTGEVAINMTYVGPKMFGDYGYNVYTLKGFAPFSNLFKFFWYIENGRRLFKISTLHLSKDERKDEQTGDMKILVNYDMELQAFFSSIPELNASPGERLLSTAALNTNPFQPLILGDIPAAKEDEIDIERSDLKAVIPGRAMIIDQKQRQRFIEEGDGIYLGSVTKIIPELGKVECLLNKGGVPERYELSIRQGQPIK